MRIGQNPAKSIDHVPQPAKVTVAVITYIPFLSGYYAQALDILKVCLESLWQHTPHPYDLFVFDNASCPEVRAYLLGSQSLNRIQYLVLSDQNVGKGGAWNFIFQAAPGEYIAYADSDVAFSAGWLENSLELVEAFPKVGMVTARPMRTPEAYFTSTLDWAWKTPDVTLEQGQFQSWEVFKEHNDSLGVAENQARQWFDESYDWRLSYQGHCAYIGAAHYQFLAPKAVLQKLFPIPMDRPMGQVRALDDKLNSEGFLRLNTCEPLVRHLGNRLDGASLPVQVTGVAVSGGKKHRSDEEYPSGQRRRRTKDTKEAKKVVRGRGIFQFGPLRRSLLWLYDRIFRIYYG
jgi:glycosyltransferase involved in cell wall biosynthesis